MTGSGLETAQSGDAPAARPRPGGRSARVQASVHQAVRDLLSTMDRQSITIPMIAARAGVTPSTIYRRWGELPDLLADVALERLRPETDPADTGSLRGDLETWLDQYLEEMSSTPGRALMHDVLAGGAEGRTACRCCDFTRRQMTAITTRAARRGETAPDPEHLIDALVAPVVYRILFDTAPVSVAFGRALIDRLLPPAPAQS